MARFFGGLLRDKLGSVSMESEPDGWLIPRLVIRSVAILVLLIALLIAFLYAFVRRFRRSIRK